jgi:tripartite-type tricarboxylate transporter receptor subunit TctC
MRASRVLFAILFVVMATLAMWSQARAQDYPARPVTVIVPFAPGGGVDQMARLISGKLEQRLGRSFIIENKPGAGSIIAATHVQKSAPDGYTLLMAPAPTMAVNVSLYKNLPYDPTTDFSLIGLLSGTPFVLMVNVDLPVKSVPELLAYAKANADKMTFASAGPGVPHHLFMELFKSMTGMKASHVPYRGSLPALNDLVAGHIPMMFSDLGPATGLIEGKRVRVLGISTRTRHPSFPDIPPLGEAGVPGYEAVSWQAMAAPAQTPKPVLDKLNSEITAVLAMPEVREQILKYGFLPLQNRSVDELKSFVKSEIVRWGKVVSDAGIAGSQ